MTTEAKIVDALGRIVGVQEALTLGTKAQTLGAIVSKSQALKDFRQSKTQRAAIEVKTAITASGAINDPLTPSMKPAIDPGTRRALRVRDLLITSPTNNAAIEMPVKDTSTIGSPVVQGGQNTLIGEGGMTFVDSFVPVQTIGYWIPASRQVIEDSPTLEATINTELLWGLGLSVEDQLLNGDGTGSNLSGLLANASAFIPSSPALTSEIDIVRSGMRQIRKSDFAPNAILLNPDDWEDIETRKAGASDDTYAAGQPKASNSTLWGLPVVETNSIASGTFLVGDFNNAGVLFERETAEVVLSQHDGTNFQRGMLSIKVSERLCWVTTNNAALVKGTF